MSTKFWLEALKIRYHYGTPCCVSEGHIKTEISEIRYGGVNCNELA
jgi:hypothetical protein